MKFNFVQGQTKVIKALPLDQNGDPSLQVVSTPIATCSEPSISLSVGSTPNADGSWNVTTGAGNRSGDFTVTVMAQSVPSGPNAIGTFIVSVAKMNAVTFQFS